MDVQSLKSPITIFCNERGIPSQIKTAFTSYLQSVYADKYRMDKGGNTIHIVLNKLSQEDLADAWQDFVTDLARYLTQSSK